MYSLSVIVVTLLRCNFLQHTLQSLDHLCNKNHKYLSSEQSIVTEWRHLLSLLYIQHIIYLWPCLRNIPVARPIELRLLLPYATCSFILVYKSWIKRIYVPPINTIVYSLHLTYQLFSERFESHWILKW